MKLTLTSVVVLSVGGLLAFGLLEVLFWHGVYSGVDVCPQHTSKAYNHYNFIQTFINKFYMNLE